MSNDNSILRDNIILILPEGVTTTRPFMQAVEHAISNGMEYIDDYSSGEKVVYQIHRCIDARKHGVTP